MRKVLSTGIALAVIVLVLTARGEVRAESATLWSIHKAGVRVAKLRSPEKKLSETLKAMEIKSKTLGANHIRLAQTHHNAGYLYYNLREMDKAEEHFIRSWEILRKNVGSNHPRSANALNILATFYYNRGMFAESEELYERSINIRKKLAQSDPLPISRLRRNLEVLRQAMRGVDAANHSANY